MSSAARRPHNRTATKLFESGDFSTGGWEQFKDDATGDFFFFHTETGETTWDEPFPGAADQLSHKRQKTLDGVTNPMNAHRHKGGNGIAVGVKEDNYSSFELEIESGKSGKSSNLKTFNSSSGLFLKNTNKNSSGSGGIATWIQILILFCMCTMLMILTVGATQYFMGKSYDKRSSDVTSPSSSNSSSASGTSGGANGMNNGDGPGSSNSAIGGSGPDISSPDTEFSRNEIITTVNGEFADIKYGANKYGKDLVTFTLPDASFNKLFVMTNTIEQGDGVDYLAHMAAGPSAVMYFGISKQRTKVTLYKADLSMKAESSVDELLVDEATHDQVLWSTNILTDENGKVEVDMTTLVNSAFGTPFGTLNGKHQNFSHGHLKSAASFPRNVNFVVEMTTETGVMSYASEHATLKIMFCMALLPEIPMIPRAADHRIGYFAEKVSLIGVKDGKKNFHATDVDRQSVYINRWRLEKSSNCNAGLCDPIVPLVFHIDPTVPLRWRKYVKTGVELWQKAFEKIGFRNTPTAISVGDVGWPTDYNSGDIRYPSIAFTVSKETTFAMAPSTSDPRTGEILDSDIMFAQEWIAAFAGENSHIEMTTGTMHGSYAASDKEEDEDEDIFTSIRKKFKAKTKKMRAERKGIGTQHNSFHNHNCQHHHLKAAGSEIAHSMRGIHASHERERRRLPAGNDNDGEISEETIGLGVSNIVAHEFGHSLGLRHNFAASFSVPYDQLYNGTFTRKHGFNSVMDYITPIVAPDDATQVKTEIYPGGHTIGAYDMLAIEYGYTVIAGEQADEQHPITIAIADRMAMEGLVFKTDEDAGYGVDPMARRYDVSDDPVKQSLDLMTAAQNMRDKAHRVYGWESKDGWADTTAIISRSIMMQFKAATIAASYIGGRVISHEFVNAHIKGVGEEKYGEATRVLPVSGGYMFFSMYVTSKFITDPYFRNNMQKLDQQVQWTNDYSFFGLEDTMLRSRRFDYMVQTLMMDIMHPDNLLRIYQTSQVATRNLYNPLPGAGPSFWTPPAPYADHPSAPPVMTVYGMLQYYTDRIWKFQTDGWKNQDEWDLCRFWAYLICTIHKMTADDTKYVHVGNDVAQMRSLLLAQIGGAKAALMAIPMQNVTDPGHNGQIEFLYATGNLVHYGTAVPGPPSRL